MTVLWRSLGTDSTNTLGAWRQQQGFAGIYQNQAICCQGSVILGGHPEWQDGVFQVRFTVPPNGLPIWPSIFVHATGAANWVTAGINNNIFGIGKMLNGQYTWINPGGAPTVTLAANTSYWLRLTCVGFTYTAQCFTDSSGAPGSLLGALAVSISDPILQSGQVGIGSSASGLTANPTGWGGTFTSPVVFGGAFANVCTWSDVADYYGRTTMPSGYQPLAPAPTPASTSVAFTDSFANLSNWTTALGSAPSVASNVVSVPSGTVALDETTIYGDGVYLLRIQNPTNATAMNPSVFVRSGVVPTQNGIEVLWNNHSGAWFLMIAKYSGGQFSYLAACPTTIPVVQGNWYWVRVVCQGPSITAIMYNDASGALGSEVARCVGNAPDPALQSGYIGFGSPNTEHQVAGPISVGGAYSGVCTFSTFNPASGAGEPAFAWAPWQAYAGAKSLAIYRATADVGAAQAGWQSTAEATQIAASGGAEYGFGMQVRSSKPANTALVVAEYNSSGSLLATTTIASESAGSVGNWLTPYRIVTNPNAVPRLQPDFNAAPVGRLYSGAAVVAVGPPVPDLRLPGYSWLPIIAYNVPSNAILNAGYTAGMVAYIGSWDAVPYAPYGGVVLSNALITGGLTTQPTTAFMAVRMVEQGPGMHYFDAVTVVAASSTAGALWWSQGTDGTGTLAAWTQHTGTSTIASHVVTSPVNAVLLGGHPDWQDVTYRQRVFWATGCQPRLWLRYGGGSGMSAVLDGTNLTLSSLVSGTTTSLAAVGAALTTGTWYWVEATAQGTVMTVKVYNDIGGIEGTTLLAEAAANIPSTITQGQVGLGSGGGSTACQFGGAFHGVCMVLPVEPPPADWFSAATSGEPAFCWDGVDTYGGNSTLSIYEVAGAAAVWASGLPAPAASMSVTPSTSYTVSMPLQVTGAGTASVVVTEYNAAGAVITSHTHTTGATGWATQTLTFTTSASAATIGLQVQLSGAGQLNAGGVTVVNNVATAATAVVALTGAAAGTFHLAGADTSVPLVLGIYMRSNQGGPQITYNFDSTELATFGLRAPVVRYGVALWRTGQLNTMFFDQPTMAALTALRNQGFDTGTPMFFRDTSGRMICCAWSTTNQMQHEPSNYLRRQDLQMNLLEVPNNVSPSTPYPYVQGLRSLVYGSLPALDPSEEI